jgi:large subunit ribosomal protein L1
MEEKHLSKKFSLLPINIMAKIVKLTNRSKKYSANFALIQAAIKVNKSEIFSVENAVKLILTLDNPSFKEGPSMELHAKLGVNATKSDQLVRSSVTLPHGTGKNVIVAAFVNPENTDTAKKAGADIVGAEELIAEIVKNGKVNFEKAIAEPDMMKKLAPIARILGTAGVMPNPKMGTVGTNIAEMIKLIKAGKVDYRNDKTGNVHFAVGKINKDFDEIKLVENIKAAIESIEKSKPDVIKKKFIQSIYLCSSMSPSIRVA